jgi:heat shock protein HslJ
MLHKITRSKILPVLGLLLLLSFAAAACGGKTPDEPITDITWQWTSLRETESASLSVTPDPENYTLTLLPDGALSIKADCNMVSGSYAIDGSEISIELGPSTMAFCGEDSLDLQCLKLLGEVESYRLEDNQLVLELTGNAGEMVFTAE